MINPKTKLTIYMQFILPAMIYRSVAWQGAARGHFNCLEQLQRRCIRTCLNLPAYTPNAWIEDWDILPPVEEVTKSRNRKFFEKIQQDPEANPLVSSRIDQAAANPRDRTRFHNPYDATMEP